MRPRELTIEGFRSYRGATTFDWRDRRLVGIVGPIGAGKSSILDAVAFALYGKTPGIGSATKSLIHQQCTEAHVSLTFEVDGQIWQAVRAPKRKGQSGHQLRHLAADEPDAEVLETVTMEGAVNERITHLLGMDFDTFCRSVLLAQNRFSDFLKATKTDRDKVLKGVFGFEQIDAAKLAAERRLDRETMALEAFAREREGIDQARERLEEARGLAEQTRSRLKAFEDCAPRVEELVAQEAAARSDADVAASRIDELARVADTLPAGEQVSAVLDAATEARGTVEQTKAAVEQAERARELADADLIQVRERLGDREQLRTFERLVEQLDEHGRAFAKAADAHAQRERQLAETRELVEQTPCGIDRGPGIARPGRRSPGGSIRRDQGGARRPRHRATRGDGPRVAWIAGRRRSMPRVRTAGGHPSQAWCRTEGGLGRREGARQGRARRGRPARREGTARHHRRRGHEGGE